MISRIRFNPILRKNLILVTIFTKLCFELLLFCCFLLPGRCRGVFVNIKRSILC